MHITERAPLSQQRLYTAGAFERVLVGWGFFTIGVYLLSFIASPQLGLGYLRMIYLGSGIVWCLFAGAMSRFSLRLCFPVVMALVIQLWAFITMIHAWHDLGRRPNIGRPELFILEFLVPYFIASTLCYLVPQARKAVLRGLLLVCALTCGVALLQFFKFPPAMMISKYYAYKNLDNWDGTAALRSIGLSIYPPVQGFMGIVGLSILGSASITRRPNFKEMALMFMFSASVVTSQARITFGILVIVWCIILYFMYQHSRPLVLKVLGTACVFLAIALMAGQNRLGYALQSFSLDEDPSFQFRAEGVWSVADRIAQEHPIFGIGPDGVFFMGQGIEDQYNAGAYIMESGYRLFSVTYGIPGIVLFLVTLVGCGAVSIALVRSKKETVERRKMGFIALCITIAISITAYTINTVDGYTIPQLAFIIAGLAVPTRWEMLKDERRNKMDSGELIQLGPPDEKPKSLVQRTRTIKLN